MHAISYDPAKRNATLAERGLDFADAVEVFAGDTATERDKRQDYGELRFIAAGLLNGRLVVLVWTPRGDVRRIISMRAMHDKEAERWQHHLRPGG